MAAYSMPGPDDGSAMPLYYATAADPWYVVTRCDYGPAQNSGAWSSIGILFHAPIVNHYCELVATWKRAAVGCSYMQAELYVPNAICAVASIRVLPVGKARDNAAVWEITVRIPKLV